MKNKILVLLVGLVLGGVFYYTNWKINNRGPETKLCYIRNTEDGESRNLAINISGKKVTGWLNVLKLESLGKTGVIEGEIIQENLDGTRVVSADWDFVSGDRKEKVKINIILDEGIAVFEDLNLSEVPCDKEFEDMANFNI